MLAIVIIKCLTSSQIECERKEKKEIYGATKKNICKKINKKKIREGEKKERKDRCEQFKESKIQRK